MPMPHLITEGRITGQPENSMYLLAQLITHGNGIAIASKHAGKGLELNLSGEGWKDTDQLKSSTTPFSRLYLCPS